MPDDVMRMVDPSEVENIKFRVMLPPVYFETEQQAREWVKATLGGAKQHRDERNRYDYGGNSLHSVAFVQKKRLVVKWE